MLAHADIRVGGERPWDIAVHDERFYRRVLASGTLGLGESYMEGWWDCEALDEMCFRALHSRADERLPVNFHTIFAAIGARILNLQNKRRSRLVGLQHYDLGNDFFETMLDPAMQYSCARFDDTDDLAMAQQKKLDSICQKLGLQPGMRLLDIGCGWGGLSHFAAEKYGCNVLGITISKEQQRYAEKKCAGLPVEIRLQDYRETTGTFDRVVSVGMLEHVGFKNYSAYFQTVRRVLANDGLFLCRSIGDPISQLDVDPWIKRYIFPNSILPSAAQIAHVAERFFILEELQNFGPFYDRTLIAWEENFRNAWSRFAEHYDESFRRMWRFYLLSCAGAFRSRRLELYEFLFSSEGAPKSDLSSR